MTLPQHPPRRYVGLYGSRGGSWRDRCKQRLEAAGIPWYDPTDSRWEPIDHESGDCLQGLVDTLVAEEHRGLLDAGCVVFHLRGGPEPPSSLAARFELGLAAGSKVQTFVSVEPDAVGRNYVWAAAELYSHVESCKRLEDAVERAVQWMVARKP